MWCGECTRMHTGDHRGKHAQAHPLFSQYFPVLITRGCVSVLAPVLAVYHRVSGGGYAGLK